MRCLGYRNAIATRRRQGIAVLLVPEGHVQYGPSTSSRSASGDVLPQAEARQPSRPGASRGCSSQQTGPRRGYGIANWRTPSTGSLDRVSRKAALGIQLHAVAMLRSSTRQLLLRVCSRRKRPMLCAEPLRETRPPRRDMSRNASLTVHRHAGLSRPGLGGHRDALRDTRLGASRRPDQPRQLSASNR